VTLSLPQPTIVVADDADDQQDDDDEQQQQQQQLRRRQDQVAQLSLAPSSSSLTRSRLGP